MKELKILLIIVVLVLIGYWGIEPLAHKIMHAHIEEAIKKYNLPDFNFSDLPKKPTGNGNAENGKLLVQQRCVSCHSVKKDGMKSGMTKEMAIQSFKVVPPDLSNMGAILDKKFLYNFLLNPQQATENPKFAMPPTGLTEQEALDVLAYLQSIAKKDLSGKEVVKEGCVRCHSIKYQKIPAETPPQPLKQYLGKVPPDLSIIYKAKGEEYLHAFLNKPQALLPGTGMPRVGLNKEAQEKAIAYLEEIADPHKEQRKKVGLLVLGYLLVMTGLTYAWKKKIWKNIH